MREVFWKALGSGLSPTAAATVAGVCGATGRKWAKAAGYQRNPKHCGTRYSQVKDEFWVALRSGMTPTQAAVAAGVSENAGREWVAQAGYVPRTPIAAGHEPEPEATSRPQAMTFVERCRLEDLLEAGYSQARAAHLLKRDASTISRERHRGATDSGYRAWVAQDKVEANRARPKPRKLATNSVLLVEVVQRLEQRHSPEQIAGRLREDFPDDPEMWVSHETIYQAMYVQPRGELARQVKTALRTGRIQRKHQGRNTTDNRGHLKDMINISERPAEADDRAIPGHWEGDLIIGKGGRSAIGTLVERSSRYVVLLHLPHGRTAEDFRAALTRQVSKLPAELRRTLTWDQGKEMAEHVRFSTDTNMVVYFCDPHSPWQRGSNENTNGLLRQYFPSKADLSLHSAAQLNAVARELNNRPRQTLNWMKPSEVFGRTVASIG